MGNKLELYKIGLQTEIAADLCHILSPKEQNFAQTIRNESLKKQHLTVRIALRRILASYLKQAATKINLSKTVHGKPYLADYPEIQFNISHSADVLLVAISQVGAVGVDIEQAKFQRRDFSGLVGKCFSQSEIEYWNALPEMEKAAEFYRFWTRKEAFVKAVGRGLAIGLQHCVIDPGKQPYFISLPENYGKPSEWRLFDLPLKEGLYGALVVESSKIPPDFAIPKIIPFTL